MSEGPWFVDPETRNVFKNPKKKRWGQVIQEYPTREAAEEAARLQREGGRVVEKEVDLPSEPS